MRTATTRTITGKVLSDGTPAGGGSFTSVKAGTGVYDVTVAPGLRLLGAVAWTLSGNLANGGNVAPTDRGFRVSTFSIGGANADTTFMFVAAVAA